ncbi:MAG: hypothetical protein CSA44_01765 [Gammaproteobacteria bacterium]|nr:MAG: hypothetical protein CSA44_01765 [Gammaproteobacteria bacterium]
MSSKDSKKGNRKDNKKQSDKRIDKKPNGRDYIAIIKELLIGLLVANGMAALSGLIGVYISLTLSVVVLILSCIPIAILSGVYSIRLITLFIFTAMLGISVSYLAVEHNVLASGKIIEGIPVNMAPQHQDAVAFVFTDATVRSEYMGEIMYTDDEDGSISYIFTYAVPLVSPDWTEDKPVPAWAVFVETVRYTSDRTSPPSLLFNTDFKVAVATEEDDSYDAIEDACEKHGLISNENARVLRLAYSIEDEIYKVVSMLKGLVIGFNVVWIIIFWIMAWRINVDDYATKESDSQTSQKFDT